MTDDVLLRIAKKYFSEPRFRAHAHDNEHCVDLLFRYVENDLQGICQKYTTSVGQALHAGLRMSHSAQKLRVLEKGFRRTRELQCMIKEEVAEPSNDVLTDIELYFIANRNYPGNVIEEHARHPNTKKDYLARFVVGCLHGLCDECSTDKVRLRVASNRMDVAAGALQDVEGGFVIAQRHLVLYGEPVSRREIFDAPCPVF